MKKLRLLLFEDCNRNCEGCCNKQWDLNTIQVIKAYELANYDLIMLTGGEPMLKPNIVLDTIKIIRTVSKAQIVMYTADVSNRTDITHIMNLIDGITITLHEQSDVQSFIEFATWVAIDVALKDATNQLDKHYGMRRLNVFKEVELPDNGIDNKILSHWAIKKDIVWLDPCPLPEGEEFKKIS